MNGSDLQALPTQPRILRAVEIQITYPNPSTSLLSKAPAMALMERNGELVEISAVNLRDSFSLPATAPDPLVGSVARKISAATADLAARRDSYQRFKDAASQREGDLLKIAQEFGFDPDATLPDRPTLDRPYGQSDYSLGINLTLSLGSEAAVGWQVRVHNEYSVDRFRISPDQAVAIITSLFGQPAGEALAEFHRAVVAPTLARWAGAVIERP